MNSILSSIKQATLQVWLSKPHLKWI